MSIYNLLRFVNNLRSFNDCFLQHKFTYLPLSQIHTISVSYKTFSSSCKAVGIYINIFIGFCVGDQRAKVYFIFHKALLRCEECFIE